MLQKNDNISNLKAKATNALDRSKTDQQWEQ
jgi:hypothetical protein